MINISPFMTNLANPFTKTKQPTAFAEKSFGDYLSNAVDKTAQMGKQVETEVLPGIMGQGNLVTMMTSLEELGLTAKIAAEFHKKIIQAYKDINQIGV